MFANVSECRKFCLRKGIKAIDFKLLNLEGRWFHLTLPVERLDEKIMENGIGFDGSSYGFTSLEKSDMVFKPDFNFAFEDPFSEIPTLSIAGNIYSLGDTIERFSGDPRYIAERAEAYLKSTGIADKVLFGPEFEFYLLDHISYTIQRNKISVLLDAEQADWHTNDSDYQNLGYKVRYQKGYHADLPNDVNFELRKKMVLQLEEMGVPVKYHHAEVGSPGQMEIEVCFDHLLKIADRTMLLKYVVKNMALAHQKTVTFMPKPFYQEAGSGMHIHLQFFKNGEPIFYDETGYSGLSQTALYAIGGILKHSPALLAFTNPSTNSYKRLVPGYEAPVSICYATANRSAVIRIPGYVHSPQEKRFEFRPSDATCNPYLAYSALLMAALDGIQQGIDPVEEGFGPYDVNVFELSAEERAKIKALPKSLEEAADALEKDYDFLLKGGVFTEELLKEQLRRIRKAAGEVKIIPHPKEFELYFDL
ncbi:MAG: type I glutamate--ammonia ligase [Peptococcia bacterium]